MWIVTFNPSGVPRTRAHQETNCKVPLLLLAPAGREAILSKNAWANVHGRRRLAPPPYFGLELSVRTNDGIQQVVKISYRFHLFYLLSSVPNQRRTVLNFVG